MKRLPQFSLRYLLAMMFWWSLAFVMFRECAGETGRLQAMKTSYYVLFFPIAAGPAIGGVVLKMRAGFVIGLLTSAVLWLLVVCIEHVSRM
jgi:succinate-acetate transporter protein